MSSKALTNVLEQYIANALKQASTGGNGRKGSPNMGGKPKGGGKGANAQTPPWRQGNKGPKDTQGRAGGGNSKPPKEIPTHSITCKCQGPNVAPRYCVIAKLVANPTWTCSGSEEIPCGFEWAQIAWEAHNKKHHAECRRAAKKQGMPNPVENFDCPPSRSASPAPPVVAPCPLLSTGVSMDDHVTAAMAEGKSRREAYAEAAALVPDAPEAPAVNAPTLPKPGEITSKKRTQMSNRLEVLEKSIDNATEQYIKHTKLAEKFDFNAKALIKEKVQLESLLASNARIVDEEDVLHNMFTTDLEKLFPDPSTSLIPDFEKIGDEVEKQSMRTQHEALCAQYTSLKESWKQAQASFDSMEFMRESIAEGCEKLKVSYGKPQAIAAAEMRCKRGAEDAGLAERDAEEGGAMQIDWRPDGTPISWRQVGDAATYASVAASSSASTGSTAKPCAAPPGPARPASSSPPPPPPKHGAARACPKPSGSLSRDANTKSEKAAAKAQLDAEEKAKVVQEAAEHKQRIIKEARQALRSDAKIGQEEDDI